MFKKTVLKMWSQKSTRRTSLVPRVCQRLYTLSFYFFVFAFFSKSIYFLTNRLFCHKSGATFSKQFSLNNLFCFLLVNLQCLDTFVNCVTKYVTVKFTPWKSKFQASQSEFWNKNLAFYFRLSKTYSINLSLKNTLGLYVFESFRQETKNLFEKSELNF